MIDTTTVRSNLIGAVIAFVIYVAIALLTGSSLISALGVGVILFVATFLISYVISMTIRRRR